jgi:hypothetical protein
MTRREHDDTIMQLMLLGASLDCPRHYFLSSTSQASQSIVDTADTDASDPVDQ